MISRVLEWYRIVNVQPTSETVDRRSAGITRLVKALDDAEDWDSILGTTAGLVGGFDQGHAADAPHVAQIITSIKAEDSTFPQDLTENALELRTAAAIALGELMARNGDKPADKIAVFVAMLIESGMGIRPQPDGKHLARVFTELTGLARKILNIAQQHRRKRVPVATKKVLAFDENVAEPLPALKSLAAAVKAAFKELNQQAAIDREELDILWWLYAATSTTVETALSELLPGNAAIACGVEVADLCLLPPLANADAFVRRAMKEVKRSDTKRTLDKIIADTDRSVWPLLMGHEDESVLGEAYPTLFPLSWLCRRLHASGVAAGWTAEFVAKTGLGVEQSVQPVDLAMQAFRERIAQRQYTSAD